MSEEDIVARVGAHVREEREAEPDPEAAKPLGDEAVDRIAAKVSRKAAPAAAKEPRGKVLAFPRWARSYAAPIAVAAAVVLFVATRDHGAGGVALPGYAVTASGEEAVRGDHAPSTRLRVGKGTASRFEIVARPETSAGEAKVVAYVFAMDGDEPVAVDAKVDVSKDGAVRVTGDARRLGTSKELRIVLGTPESIGNFQGASDRAKAASSDAKVKVLVVAIDRD